MASRMTAERLSPTPCSTSPSISARSASLNRVGTGVVVQNTLRRVDSSWTGAVWRSVPDCPFGLASRPALRPVVS